MGVEVHILNLKNHKETFEDSYTDLNIPSIYCEIEEIPDIAASFDAAIASLNPSVSWVAPAI